MDTNVTNGTTDIGGMSLDEIAQKANMAGIDLTKPPTQIPTYDEILLACKGLLKDLKDAPIENEAETFKHYATCDKWNAFFRNNHIIFNVLIFSKMYSKDGIRRYLEECAKGPVDSDERFYSIAKSYLLGFDIALLKKRKYTKDMFIQYYMTQMRNYIDNIKAKVLGDEQKKQREEEMKLKQREISESLLRRRLGLSTL